MYKVLQARQYNMNYMTKGQVIPQLHMYTAEIFIFQLKKDE